MNDDDSRKPSGLPGGANDDGPERGRREPVFSDFDEDEDFEESDRDTDFASAYEEEELDDEDYPEPHAEGDNQDDTDDWQPVTESHEWGEDSRAEASKNPWDVAPAEAPDNMTAQQSAPATALSGQVEEDVAPEDSDDDWDDEYDEAEEDDQDYTDEPREAGHGWPLGLIVVGLVALVLLAAGGYGVIQQRSATQEEVRQLQAALATAASPTEVAASREALQAMEQRYAEQQASMDALLLENRRLEDTVAGLESQLVKQQAVISQPVAPQPAAKPVIKPKPVAPKSAPAKPAAKASSGSGDWFVNFSSYSQRSAAESWAKKLQPSTGRAVVAPVNSNGKTFYRVRVVGLTDRAQAEKVASQLQSTHGVSKLWVGEEK
jgi:cell division septation protein DedD